jgi:hypothetical protein
MDERTRLSLEEQTACVERKEDRQIAHERAVSRDFWGCEPFFYSRYRLYRRKVVLTDEEIRRFIPEYMLFVVYFPLYNASPLANVVGNKIACSLLFHSVGIRHAAPLAYSMGGQIYGAGMQRLDDAGLARVLDSQRSGRVFIKPEGGSGGKGVLAVDVDSAGSLTQDHGAPIDFDEILRRVKCADMLVERGLVQSAEIGRIHPNSVNTFRIATALENGRARLVYSSLRVGTEGKAVDNFCQNGLVVGVDNESGAFQPRAINQWGGSFPSHPETGIAFAGNRVAAWPELRDFVLDAHERLPFYKHLGWDIALTEDGPVAVETNLGWDIDLPQLLFGGVRDLVPMPLPKALWARHRDRVR